MDRTYKHLKIKNAKESPTFEEIKEIENHLGAKLPQDFLNFLNVANGGYLNYSIDIDGEPISFCSIHRSGKSGNGEYGYGTFIGEMLSDRENIISIPEKVLPFALDGGNSSGVYLDLTPEGNGRIVAFVHGLPEWTGRERRDKFIEIASNFSEYVELLYENDESDYI